MNGVTLEPDASGPNPSIPRKLAEFPNGVYELVPTADHQRFLAVRTVETDEPIGIRAVLGWAKSLESGAKK